MRKAAFAAVAFLPLALAGCATIVHGSRQEVSFGSSPTGAIVTVNGEQRGVTPVTLNLQRKKDYIISFSYDGFQTQTYQVQSVVSGWIAGNILLGGIVGGAIDLVSGAAFRLVPEHVNTTLAPLAPGETAIDPSTVTSLSTEQRLENLRRLRDQGLITEQEHDAQRKLILEESGGDPK